MGIKTLFGRSPVLVPRNRDPYVFVPGWFHGTDTNRFRGADVGKSCRAYQELWVSTNLETALHFANGGHSSSRPESDRDDGEPMVLRLNLPFPVPNHSTNFCAPPGTNFTILSHVNFPKQAQPSAAQCARNSTLDYLLAIGLLSVFAIMGAYNELRTRKQTE
jgi:hypothetical protein